jgi:hypothetical protein
MKRPYLIPAIRALRVRGEALTQTINALERLAQDHVEQTVRSASVKNGQDLSLLLVGRNMDRSDWLSRG